MYANDIVLLALSVKGLQKLINVYEKYGVDYDILYNHIDFNDKYYRSLVNSLCYQYLVSGLEPRLWPKVAQRPVYLFCTLGPEHQGTAL